MTKTIELTDEEMMHIRVALLLRLARLRHAIDNTADAADVAAVRADSLRSCEAITALLDGKMRRVGQ